jgi:hypothetical protein
MNIEITYTIFAFFAAEKMNTMVFKIMTLCSSVGGYKPASIFKVKVSFIGHIDIIYQKWAKIRNIFQRRTQERQLRRTTMKMSILKKGP